MKRLFLFLFLFILMLCFVGCGEDSNESSNYNDNSIIIKADGKEYYADYNINEDLGNVVIYDRDFVVKNNGSISLENHTSRKLYKISVDHENYIVKGTIEPSDSIIPYNGLIISFADTTIDLKYNSVLDIENYIPLKNEATEFASFSVNGERRRIYLKDPTVDYDEDIIVYITDDFGKSYSIKENQIAFSIIKDKYGSYFVGERLNDIVPENTFALIFSGKYNISYAEKIMIKDKKISFKNLSSANNTVFNPSVAIDDSIYQLKDHDQIDENGVYIFDCMYDKYVAPISKNDFVCAIVSDDRISFVGELNQQLVIPNNGGYLVVFVGQEYIALAEENQIIETMLITPTTSKESEIKLEYSLITKTLNGIDKTREANNLIVYTPSYGKTTKTNEWGCEVAVDKNGTMVEYSTSGNMVIPEGGFVISAHGDMINWLRDNYLYGSEVKFDRNGMKVTISVTPLSTISSVVKSYEIVKSNYDQALKTYREFNVEKLDSILLESKKHIDNTGSSDLNVVIESIFAANKAINDASNLYFSSSTVENRAVWYAPTEKSEADVRRTIELIKSLNINALYIETWRSGQTNYKTKLDLTFHESTYAGFDVLEAFVRLGHENGIEIHAWVHDFFVGTDYHKKVKGHVLNVHPEWALETRSGSVLNPTEYGNFMFLNPYKRECRDLLLSVYREILENYDVDGLHLDYIRFPEPNSTNEDWGYNDDIIAGFQAEYNTTIDPHQIKSGHSMWNNWCKFREDIITSFVGEVYNLIQEINPNIWLSAAIYPNMNATPKTIFQNFVPWVENGWMDEIFAMSYASSANTVIDISSNFLNTINGKCFYSAGIGAFAQYGDVSYMEQIERLRDTTAVGTNIFSLASVNGNSLMELLQETVYRNETVQVYDTKCVLTYLLSMVNRCDGVYKKSDLSEADLKKLKDILSSAIDEIDKIKISDNNRLSKKQYFESSLCIIDKIDVSEFNSKDSTLCSALNNQLESLKRIIRTNIIINS